MYKPFGSFMREIKVRNGKLHLKDEIEIVTEGVIKRIGNGAMILSSKKYIGRKAYVLIKKED